MRAGEREKKGGKGGHEVRLKKEEIEIQRIRLGLNNNKNNYNELF